MSDFERYSEILRVDAETGKLFWKARTFTGPRSKMKNSLWAAKFENQEAFTANDGRGYRRSMLFGKSLLAHRVVWLLITGSWPDGQLDHINGVKDDNRFLNLRCVNNSENSRNQRLGSANTSGRLGVGWRADKAVWVAKIKISGVSLHLGYFSCFFQAVRARKNAEAIFGFHPNHGRRS